MDYLVYIRFEDNPSEARKHILAAERAGGAQYVLDARYEATPGDETAALHNAFDAAFGLNKYITLYRGFPVGQDVRGRKLFTPVGLVWCKDRAELGQMLGLEMSYEIQENFKPSAHKLEDEAHPEADVHSPWSQGGAKNMDWTRPTRIPEEGRDWNSKWLEESPVVDGAGDGFAGGSPAGGDVSGSDLSAGRQGPGGANGVSAGRLSPGGTNDVSDGVSGDGTNGGGMNRSDADLGGRGANDGAGARRPGRNLFAPNPPAHEFDAEAAARAEWNERSRGSGGNGNGISGYADDARKAGRAAAARSERADADRPRARSPWATADTDTAAERRAPVRDRYDDDDDLYDDDMYDDMYEGKPRGNTWKWLLAFVVCLVGSFLLVYGGARLISG